MPKASLVNHLPPTWTEGGRHSSRLASLSREYRRELRIKPPHCHPLRVPGRIQPRQPGPEPWRIRTPPRTAPCSCLAAAGIARLGRRSPMAARFARDTSPDTPRVGSRDRDDPSDAMRSRAESPAPLGPPAGSATVLPGVRSHRLSPPRVRFLASAREAVG